MLLSLANRALTDAIVNSLLHAGGTASPDLSKHPPVHLSVAKI